MQWAVWGILGVLAQQACTGLSQAVEQIRKPLTSHFPLLVYNRSAHAPLSRWAFRHEGRGCFCLHHLSKECTPAGVHTGGLSQIEEGEEIQEPHAMSGPFPLTAVLLSDPRKLTSLLVSIFPPLPGPLYINTEKTGL